MLFFKTMIDKLYAIYKLWIYYPTQVVNIVWKLMPPPCMLHRRKLSFYAAHSFANCSSYCLLLFNAFTPLALILYLSV